MKPVLHFSTTLLLLTLALSSARAFAQQPETLARQSADKWLALVDSGNYAQSWQDAASTFKNAVSNEQWQQMLHATRDPLGNVLSRTFKSAHFTKTLPGAPDGNYVVIQYDTSFEHKQSSVETVTPMLDKDRQWRVSGYFTK